MRLCLSGQLTFPESVRWDDGERRKRLSRKPDPDLKGPYDPESPRVGLPWALLAAQQPLAHPGDLDLPRQCCLTKGLGRGRAGESRRGSVSAGGSPGDQGTLPTPTHSASLLPISLLGGASGFYLPPLSSPRRDDLTDPRSLAESPRFTSPHCEGLGIWLPLSLSKSQFPHL